MSRRSFVPRRPQALRIARKAHDGEHGKCPYCQEKLRVSQPGDALEHEADRAADAVISRAAPAALSPAGNVFQRDALDDAAKPPEEAAKSHTLGAGMGKVAEAAAQTPAGKQALKKAEKEGKKILSDPGAAAAAGVVVAGIGAGAGAGLAATHQKLPMQPPPIPLGDGYKLGVHLDGRVDKPSGVGVTFGGNLPGEPKQPKDKKNERDYGAEAKAIRASLDMFKPKPPGTHLAPGALAPLAEPGSPVHQPAPAPEPPRKKETPAAPLQRKARGAAITSEPVLDALDENGDALDAHTQHFMEQRFGRDFSAVRIHTGPRGAKAADALNARAFTYGEHVSFASGEYHPGTESGRRLLAHELAHVAQQGAAPINPGATAVALRHPDTGPAMPLLSSAVTPTLAREPKPDEAPKEPVTVTVESANELNGLVFKVWPSASSDSGIAGFKSFNVDALVLPATKGPKALDVYKRYVQGRALSATIRAGNDPQASLWQERAGTDQLKRRWLDLRGWPTGKKADEKWKQAGGDDQFPQLDKKACQMDHIVELQLTGNNTNENIQALDGTKNRASGTTLWAELSGLARAIQREDKLAAKDAQQIQMNFTNVVMQGTPETLPTPPCTGKQTSCLAVESCAGNINADAPAGNTQPYPLVTDGGHETTVKVPKDFNENPSAAVVSFDTSENKAAATLIPGLLFKQLRHDKPHHTDFVDATIDTEGKTRLPITFDVAKAAAKAAAAAKKPDLAPVKLQVRKPQNLLKFAENNKIHLPFEYLGMSPGVITKLTPTPNGLDFAGSITPTVPFLGKLDIAYKDGVLSVTKGLDLENYKSPLKGAKITKADIGLDLAPELKAKGELGFEYAPSGKKLLDASLSASADTNGLKVAGDIHAYLPGVDSADGHIEYSTNGGWSGGAKATATDLKKKFKYITGGEVSIGLKGDKRGGVSVDTEGKVDLDLPHTKGVSATLKNKGGRWLFHGKGTFDVPRLKPVDIDIEYDGTTLSGEARNIGFQYKGFDASIDIKYRDEKFSGSGKLAFEKGRAKGTLQIELLPNEHFTGKGNVTIQIKEGVEASAGVELDEKEKLHVAGKLAFTKPIKLFDSFGGNATIFKAGVSIPIPGASIGPIGVKARIEGELSAGYQIGPGEIRNAAAEAHFDPLEENSNFEFEIGGQLWIGASAHITGAVTGSIVLDAVIAEVSGGLTISATASLNGEVLSNVKFTYSKDRYALTADFAASLALAIRLALEASVRAQAGIKPFEVDTEKRWTLAAREFNTGLKLGIAVKKPLSYSSDKGLEVPSPSDIEVTKPDLDASRLLKDVFGAADGKEKPA